MAEMDSDLDDVNETRSHTITAYTVFATVGIAWYCIISSIGLVGCISAYVSPFMVFLQDKSHF